MKQLLSISFMILLFGVAPLAAQEKRSYDEQWEQVDSLEKKGLPASAKEAVNKIYEEAEQNKDSQQRIKALIYRLKFQNLIEEEATEKNIREVDSLIEHSNGVERAIFQNMAAKIYLNYVRGHQYQLMNRSTSTEEETEDLATWSLPHFYDKVESLLTQSLENEEQLQGIKIEDYTTLVDTGKHAQELRPTLYDILAFDALNLFSIPESLSMRPANEFILNDPRAFATAADFSNDDFPTADSSSLLWNRLHLYQKLLAFHSKDPKPEALADINLDRLQFVYQNAVLLHKDSLYQDALERVVSDSISGFLNTKAYYRLANWYQQKELQASGDKKKEKPSFLKKALALCGRITDAPDDPHVLGCKRMKEDILKHELSLQVEEVNLPHQPFRILVKYRNVSYANFRVIPLKSNATAVFNWKANRDELVHEKKFTEWSQDLPLPDDHREHAVELKVDDLLPGRYVLIATSDYDFDPEEEPIASAAFSVSGLSFVTEGKKGFFVLDRNTGKPIRKAKVRIWRKKYNQEKRKYELKSGDRYKTNKLGYAKLTRADRKQQTLLPEITVKKDQLFVTDELTFHPSSSLRTLPRQNLPDSLRAVLFTDRAIYRPGQEVYFKGLLIKRLDSVGHDEVVKNQRLKVALFDANGQQIDTMLTRTNAYGSIQGSFTLPSALMNGRMSLRIEKPFVSQTFSVEEYKRPSFEASWDSVPNKFRLGDSAWVAGQIMGYNGVAEGEATIRYQVTRKSYRPFFRGNYRTASMILPIQEFSIVNGTLEADSTGRFRIPFLALPDPHLAEGNRVFNYEVSVEVTNRNGESHHFSYNLPIGDKNLLLSLDLPRQVKKDDFDQIRLTSTDLNGQFRSAHFSLSISKLTAPNRFVKKRLWDQPDQFVYNEKAFVGYFPHEEYKAEGDYKNWPVEYSSFVMTDTTRPSQQISINYNQFTSGWYLIKVVSKDDFGQFVTDTQYVQIYNPYEKDLPFHEVLWTFDNNKKDQPGEIASWELGTTEKIFLLSKTHNLKETDRPRQLKLNDKIVDDYYEIKEDDRGGAIKNYLTVRYNRVFEQSVRIPVPWEKKKLNIKYKTFRDKLLPGQEETWEMMITGPEGEQVNAELLASMYDASLDDFTPHQWNRLTASLATVLEDQNWGKGLGFGKTGSSSLFTPKMPTFSHYDLVYPSLRDFGFPLMGNGPILYRMNAAASGGVIQTMAMRKGKDVAAEEAADAVVPETSSPSPADREDSLGEEQPKENTGIPLQVRKDFRETAFFYPQLHTDDSGRVKFTFTSPEALTKWRLMLLANTADLKSGYSEKVVMTQKPLMVQANAPRFVRQGDTLSFSARVSNLSDGSQSGRVQLFLSDPASGDTLEWIDASSTNEFEVASGGSTTVHWSLIVPGDYSGSLSYRLEARSQNFADGEQDAIPVLTNKTFLTESLPLNFSGNGEHKIEWEALKEGYSGKSSIEPQGITIEYTGNPIWYAVQALPFIDEAKQEDANSLFNSIYANSLSTYVALHIPDFKGIMQNWLEEDSTALKSPLEKNEDLKDILLEETPWVRNAQKESLQKARVAGWYSDQDAQLRLIQAIESLKKLQLSNGGFTWFEGMKDNRLITQRILLGLGHMKALHAWPSTAQNNLNQMVGKAIPYLDLKMKDDYERMKKAGTLKGKITPTGIQYLYARSFFEDKELPDSLKEAYTYFWDKAQTEWAEQNIYLKSMLALTFRRLGKKDLAQDVLQSLTEFAIHDQFGMHWKKPANAFNWYQNQIETHSLALEAYQTLGADPKVINELRTWLLNQKRTQFWGSSENAAHAVYALLLSGDDWTHSKMKIDLKLGAEEFVIGGDSKGLQYEKIFVPKEKINQDMAAGQIKISGAAEEQLSWGALYFQYFQEMNEVEKEQENPLHIDRTISLETKTDKGPLLTPVANGESLKVGDKVVVRMVVKTDREVDFVHLKDVRASNMEPLQVLSGYRVESGVGYYSTVTDAGIHFYFQRLPKGTYVFTYSVFITQKGNFTGGLSTIESLYAPEMRAHSEGVRVRAD